MPSNQMFDPKIIFEKIQLLPGMHVADFGCGRTGHVVFSLAPLITDRGVVYAVDIMKDVLLEIKKRAAASALLNIQTIWSDLEKIGRTAIPSGSIDVGFLINVLFQSDKQREMLTEINRLLKDKSRLVVVDWARNHNAFGPSADRLIDFEVIRKWAKENGLVIQEEFLVGPFLKAIILYKNQ